MTAEAMTPEAEFLSALKALNTDRLFVHVELDRLNIDPRYQRNVNMTRVRKMAAAYDERLMGVIVCSVREDGRVYVIDGQHRLELARLLHQDSIRCELRLGLTPEDEAHMFYKLDTARVALNSPDSFRALLMADDPTANAIKQAVEDAGLRITYEGNVPGGVRAFKMLLKLTRQHGIEVIARALKVLGTAWPTSSHAAAAGVVEGMVTFLLKYPEVDDAELSAGLAQNTKPDQLMSEARTLSGTLSWNTKVSMARAILHSYNYRRSATRLEDRFAA